VPSIPGLETMNWGGVFSQVMVYLGYLLLTVVIGLGFFVGYISRQYKYKVTIMQRGGIGLKEDGNDKIHSIGKITKDRAREYKDKNGVTKWKLLFKKKQISPPSYEDIYPGRNLYLYQSGPSNFHPFKLTVSNPSAVFEPIPHDIDFWTGVELREAAQDYTKKSTWEQYGSLFVMTGTILFCLILVGVVVYFSYQHANGVVGALDGLTGSLKNVNVIG